MAHDILIRGGLLLDGTGAAGRLGDLAIRDGRIAAIGTDLGDDAAKVIDATGLAVAPGFIDIKTHSDFTLPINPKAESKVRQGVTTEIIGHCGFSVAPALPGKVELLRDYLSPSAPWLPFKETSFPAYLDSFPATAVNAGMLVGHNTLRLMVMGMADRPPTSDELAQMIALLEDALEAGALGLSSGLFTAPGSYAQPDEMIALCRVVKRYNGGYFTHLRDESNKVLDALEEAIAIAEACGVHVEIVHFKCSGTDNWGKAARALDMIAAAKARGLDVDCDSYPYAAGSNPLKNLMPQWVQAGGVAAMLERLAAKPTRERIRGDIDRDGLNNWGRLPSWDCVQISISPHLPQHAGRTIGARGRARPGPDRHRRRLPDRGQGRDAGAGHLHCGRRHPHHRAFAACTRRFRRQLRRDLWHREPGHAAPALLRHVPAHHRPLCRRARPDPAGARRSQDDGSDRARAEAQ